MHVLTLIVAAAVAVRADLVCEDWTPYNFTVPYVRVNFFGNNPSHDPAEGPNNDSPTLPANASGPSGPRRLWKLPSLADKSEPGFIFRLQTCNSTSLGFSTTVQSSCGHSGCYNNFMHNIRLINTETGSCVTALPFEDVNGTETSLAAFRTCNPDPTDLSQIWFSYQYINYPCCTYAVPPTSTEGPFFDALYRTNDTSLLPALSLSSANNRTIEIVMDSYSNVGLGAQLLPIV